MDISSTTTATTATTGGGNAAASRLTSDMTMFLKLLTTQMQNQDPLNPMDTSEYTQQLVQFSQVEQSIAQNRNLEAILARLDGQEMIGAAALVGSTGTFDSATAGLTEGGSASWRYAADGASLPLTATILDAAGAVVATRSIDSREGVFSWDGTRADGSTAAAGSYTLAIAAADGNGGRIVPDIAARGRITEAVTTAGGTLLRAGGIDYPLASLTGTGSGE